MTNFITDLFNLNKGEEDKQKTLDNVKGNISFTGSNLWILACAIMVASIGLNVNSTAVIIGAMLISPLMGPIVGAGFALGIYDFTLLRKSLFNLLIATVASLIVATLYFYLSPFKEIQSELLARTSPNIYDVLIAFFGGLAGVIAITRVEKGNPIPGVAIATALMPPLCTAGYGLATANWKFFLGALFLYSINCVFICIATYSIVKYLKYPASKQIDIKHQKQVRYGVTAIVLLMLLPSAFFAFTLYKEQQFKQLANNFIEKEFVENGSTLVYKRINYSTTSKIIELAFLKKVFTETEVQQLNEKLKVSGLSNTKLFIRQNSSDNLQSLKDDILNEVNKKDNALSEKDKSIALLEQKLSESTFDNKQLLAEINIFFPTISSVSVSKQNIALKDSTRLSTLLIYNSKPKLIDTDKDKLKTWMLKKLSIDSIEIIETEK
ncbi:TIGR00341 family protein [Arcicella sp. DC2W]|uniref:TIGR00341 family protein n=1 Tax=Arcicella gelida TaxID=2984195 RepID=A0ABU5S4B4_9BACT|nr:TIGR00341 family protein [Arcicella sp. DC2W]MEA5403312.1 TIGR00341 family protein [Arcicella sp. DC2W]